MRKKVTYEAADQKAGMTAEELREALRKALVLGPITTNWHRRIRTVEVEEAAQD